MPIPAPPDDEVTTSTAVVALLRQLHDELRGLLRECDRDALNFIPCRGANSIATIVTHVLGSEAETLRSVAGVEGGRDRDAEFRMGEQTADALMSQMEVADALLDRLAPHLTADRLQMTGPLPTLPKSETRAGVTWLIGNLGHAREHLGQASLTKQLWDGRSR